jgi:hypothetical protein
VAVMLERRNVHRHLVGKSLRKLVVGRPKGSGEGDNITIDLKDISKVNVCS